jgi:hypothetical protein
MEHNDIRHKLSEYLDGSMTTQEQAEIEAHLKTCQECETALNDLRKTIEQIKAIEEIEPPAWMTQKIMAKVRAEAVVKKSIFQRLFYPLIVKLPIQAVAVLFLAVTAFYIYQDIHPTAKYSEAPMPTTQELAVKKEAPPSAVERGEQNKTDGALLGAKQVPQAPGYKSLDMKQEYEAPSSPQLKDQIASFAPAPAKPAEQPVHEKKAMMAEKRAAAPLALSKAEMPEQNAAGAVLQAKTKKESVVSSKKAKESVDKLGTGRAFEKNIVEKYSNGNPKLVVTYETIESQRVKLAEERFNPEGKRHGIQKEYYASGQLKAEAQYELGKLEWYMEYGPDGIKKTEKTDYDWFWLKK